MNQVILVGRLTGNPMIEESINGKKYTSVIIAVQRNFKNAQGIYETDFIRCVLWNGLASSTTQYCRTGDIIGIKGRIQNRSYEDDNKEIKYISEIIVERITFLSSNLKKDREENTNEQTQKLNN